MPDPQTDIPGNVETHSPRVLASRRSLTAFRTAPPENYNVRLEAAKEHLTRFAQRLQDRYPFRFITAYRNLDSERHKQVQERLVTLFLFGAVAELSGLPPETKDRVWELGKALSRSIGKGGDNYFPREFTDAERKLAREIGEQNFHELIHHAEQLSLAMKFKIGPVNSAEHSISWCFRYLGQLLKAAKWESR